MNVIFVRKVWNWLINANFMSGALPLSLKKMIYLTVFLVFAGLTAYYFFPETKLPDDIQIDDIVVYKSKRQMLVYSDGQLLKTYKISL